MSEISFNFTGKKALVTGGSRGIGRDIVRALAEANCEKIYVLARNETHLDKVKTDFACVETVGVDLSDWEATRKAVQEIEPVDFLVNNAASARVRKIFNTNIKAALNISQIVCAKMLEKGGGSVVNISSLNGYKPTEDTFVYGISKHGLEGVTKYMAMELAPKIRVNSVQPNLTWTEMGALWAERYPERYKEKMEQVPMHRVVKLEECSDATLFLLSSAAGVTTGHSFPVSGGE